MTTVINLNLLNFFRLKLNTFTVNDTRINARFSGEGRSDPSERDDVIDVTPYSRYAADGESDNEEEINLPVPSPGGISPAVYAAEIEKTYDRRGKMIQYDVLKGRHVDSYI